MYGLIKQVVAPILGRAGAVAATYLGIAGVPDNLAAAVTTAGVAFAGLALDTVLVLVTARRKAKA